MNFPFAFHHVCIAATLCAVLQVHAESFTSSALSAGSASSGSVSESLHGSSHSSTRDDKTTADADYRVTEIAQAPKRDGIARVTLQADDPQQSLMLDLPQAIVDAQGLGRGDVVHAQPRVYGLVFSRGADREAFYLVLADDWYTGLAARPVSL